MFSSSKMATLKLGLSDMVTLATNCPCLSTPMLEEALHNLLPGLAPHPGLPKPPMWHAAGEAASPAREPSGTQHGTFQSDKPRPDSKAAFALQITHGISCKHDQHHLRAVSRETQ